MSAGKHYMSKDQDCFQKADVIVFRVFDMSPSFRLSRSVVLFDSPQKFSVCFYIAKFIHVNNNNNL